MTSVSATIHIVDDDASFRTSTGRLLRACGYAFGSRLRPPVCRISRRKLTLVNARRAACH